MLQVDFSDHMSGADPLLAEAEVQLRKRLSRAPTDENLMWNLAEVLRQRGNIGSAVSWYEKIVHNPRHSEAAHLADLLKGVPTGSPAVSDLRPCPFLRRFGFLSDYEQGLLWEVVRKKRGLFRDSGIAWKGMRSVDTELRASKTLHKKDLEEVRPWFRAKVESILEDCWMVLGLAPAGIQKFQIQMTAHHDGGFFKVHNDSVGESAPKRRITFVYYFHVLPRRFTGGELLLFDTDLKEDECAARFTRIEPTHNSVVLFPSNWYHQVADVYCTDDDQLVDSRLSVNGWVCY